MLKQNSRTFSICALIFIAIFSANSAAEDTAGVDFFESKIRPILAEQCYSCHSVKAKKVKGGLLVDSLAALLKGGESGAALVPGNPEKSRLNEAVHYKNQDLQMPPDSKLSDAQIADLDRWVKMGAPWPKEAAPQAAHSAAAEDIFDLDARKAKHWAWSPIKAHAPPSVKNAAWVKDPLDAFILNKLEEKQLPPAPVEQKAALLRRATFDLTGMPPTPAELSAFTADAAPDAFEKAVDRLLASPRYGEHWARHWFDLVRYAESYGHEFDFTINNAYQYRDYVIRAMNADVPYNQFAIEQLAGDLIEKPRINAELKINESLAATGFHQLGEDVHSPVDVRLHQADHIDNKIDVTGKTFMGLTISCARCHDHKFDAIATADYYSLYGFFKSSRYSQPALNEHVISAKAGELTELKNRMAPEIFNALKERAGTLAGRLKDWKAPEKIDPANMLYPWAKIQKPDAKIDVQWKAALAAMKTRKNVDAPKARNVADFQPLMSAILEESAFARGALFVPGSDPKRPVAEIRDAQWLATDSQSKKLQGSARTQSFTIEKPFIQVLAKGQGARISIVVDNFTLIRSPIYGGLRRKIESAELKWIDFDVTMWKGHEAYIEITDTMTPFPGEEGASLKPDNFAAIRRVVFSAERNHANEDAGHLLTALSADDKALDSLESAAARYQHAALTALEKCGPNFSKGEANDANLLNDLIEAGLLDIEPTAELAGMFKKYQELESALPQAIRGPGIVDGNGVDEHVFIRGGHRNLGAKVQRKFLTALGGHEVKCEGSGRLDYARRMADPAVNPLFTRVMVNRLWHHVFGRGIVASVDNFGVMGSAPTHPDLLDFLAERFAKDNFSLKTALRKMMLSSSYQMASYPEHAPDISKIDPNNDLLSRQRVRRLSGEAIRDSILALSGRLDSKMFGPSVETHLTAFMTGRGRPGSGPVDGAGRRSIYISVRRNFLSPMMLAFDSPAPFSSMGRRTVSNVPAQALILLNDPFVLGQAELWSKRELAAIDAKPEQIVTNMYLQAFAREPSAAEKQEALAYVEAQMKEPGATKHSAWKDLAHVLMNVKEFIYIK